LDERYNEADYAYGTGPNDFLVSIAGRNSGGRIWSLAEGEAACLTALGNEVLPLTALPPVCSMRKHLRSGGVQAMTYADLQAALLILGLSERSTHGRSRPVIGNW